MKENDWIIATMNNPTFDVGDFQYIADMTLDNTQLLSKDQYLKSKYIRESDLFKNEQGEFSEDSFNEFYQKAAQKFKEFSTEDIVDHYDYKYSMWDVTRPKEGRIKDSGFSLGMQDNPSHIGISIEGFNKISKPVKSQREYAQNSKIYDRETGQFLDVSVNDISLWNNPTEYFKSLFSEPLVYATYDQDETEIDPYTGKTIEHKKGEWKVNSDGEYYTETLNGRSLIGKEVVSSLDYLTPENSSVQKYDFFDSDGLDKSVEGTIAKNVAAVIPLFIPYVDAIYGGLLVARELGKSLPMLYGMVKGLSGSEEVDSKLANTIAAYGNKFTSSTSDYARANTFSFENFGNLMSDVALQWSQQKSIANTISRLSGGGKKAIEKAYSKAFDEYRKQIVKKTQDVQAKKLSIEQFKAYTGTAFTEDAEELIKSSRWINTPLGAAAVNKYVPAAQKVAESRMRIGQNLSLAYMAIVSNTDVYESVLEKGGTPFEAAAIALGSTIGMYTVDKYGLGEMFFQNEPARAAFRQTVKHNADLVMSSTGIKAIQETQTKKGILGLIQKGINSGKKAVQDYHSSIKNRTLGFIGKSLGEGLEEVSEELVADASKSIGELAGKLGYFSTDDYGAWENAFDRYAMSFLGGAAGGGLFYGVEAFKNRNRNTDELQNDIIYLLRQGKKGEIFKELDKLKSKGQLGSHTLSYNTTKDESGNNVYLTADENNISQSDYVYDILKKTINQLDMILNDNDLNLSDDELFDRMVQGEYRANALQDFLRGYKEKDAKEVSYITAYQQDFQELTNNIANLESRIQDHINSTPDRQRDEAYNEKLNKLKEEKAELVKQRDYLFGEGSLGYAEMMLFAININLSGAFINLTFDQFVRSFFSKSVKDLTEAEKETAQSIYNEYSKTKKKGLREAFWLFKDMQEKLNPRIQELKGLNLQADIDQISALLASMDMTDQITYDSKLEDETDEEYNSRNTKKEEETDEEFLARKQQRSEIIKKRNREAFDRKVSKISEKPIDRTTFRNLEARLGVFRQQLYDSIVEQPLVADNAELQSQIWNMIKTNDLTNIEDLYNNILETIRKSEETRLLKEYESRLGLLQWDNVKQNIQYVADMSPEERVSIGYPELFEFDPNVPLTKLDLYNYINSIILAYENQGNQITPEQLVQFLESSGWSFDEKNEQGKINKSILDFYFRVESGITDINSEEGSREANEVVEISEQAIDKMAKQEADDKFAIMKDTLDTIIETLQTDIDLKAITDLERAAFINSPIFSVVGIISQQIRGSDTNIEDFLESIYDQYKNGESANDFQLKEDQIQTLQQFKQDLEMAKAFIYAASVSTTPNTPIGHNKTINDYVERHKDVFKDVTPLPEIDKPLADVLIQEASEYIDEINVWIARSDQNTNNRDKRFVDADIAFNQARLDFYKINREKFKVTQDVDLLEGYEDLTLDNSLASIAQIEELLHRGFKKAIASGLSLEDILDAIVPEITHLEQLKKQVTARLDDKIRYDTLTSYDKLALLITNFSLSSTDYYTKLRTFITNNDGIAPLAIQEYAAKLIQAQTTNRDIINQTLEYLQKKLDLPILYNTTVITGVAGAGKTDAVVKLGISDETNIWVSGPTDSQVKGLKSSIPRASEISKLELFETILGEARATEFLNSIVYDRDAKKWVDRNKGKYFTLNARKGLDGNPTVTINSNVTVNKIQNAPKYIVIDEATHFSSAELQLIGKFAKENGIDVILLGDDTQKGHSNMILNLDREVVLAWRAPKLFISLRENNIQKVKNLSTLTTILEKLSNVSGELEQIEVTKKLLQEEFGQLSFRYSLGDTFTGELITDTISENLIQKLTYENKEEGIGFIGNASSPIYQQLVNSGKKVTLLDPLSVQGREFDYVVVDKEWSLDIDRSNPLVASNQIYDLSKDLYTMISRSRKGTILINHGLSRLISNVKDNYSGDIPSIKESVKKFREVRVLQINAALEALSKLPPEQEPPKPTTLPAVSPTTPPPSNPPSNPSNPRSNNEEPSEKEKIEGTNVTVDEIYDDEPPQPEDVTRKREKQESQDQEDTFTATTMTTPARVYSNVSYSGINTESEIWENPNDSTRDLGIFVRQNESIKETEDKDRLVGWLLDVKSFFNYGFIGYSRLPTAFKRLVSEEELKKAEYYVSVADVSPDNRLVGLTDLSQERRDIANGKVITLVAKFKGKDGRIYSITLGGLANPKIWEENAQDIATSLKARIESGDPQSAQLQDYVNHLDSNITVYKNWIEERAKTNQEIRINPPNFSMMTTLIDSENLRLENINNDSSPFDLRTRYAKVSKIHVIVDDIPGIKMTYTDAKGKERSLKGRAVIYVSSNRLLDVNELESIYIAQKTGMSNIPQVRMIVLDNLGVSFNSLYRKKYKTIYTISKGETLYTTPFKLEPMAVRMYISAWNFRSNLKRFIEEYNKFLNDNNLDQDTVEDLCRLDNQEYVRIRGDQKYLSEEEYRSKVPEELRQRLKIIWDFNDSLHNKVRQFRLGYSSQNGAYIRKLTNLKEGGYYKDINNALGIYINPRMALQYERVLDALFDNIINKVIPTETDPLTYIDTNLAADWFTQVQNNRAITVQMYNPDGTSLETTLEFQPNNSLKALPTLLIETAKFLSIRSYNIDSFDEFLLQTQSKKYNLSIGDERLDWVSLAKALDDGDMVSTDDTIFYDENSQPIGVRPLGEWGSDNLKIGVIDKRIDNLFNLMFHGTVSTYIENDFTGSDIRATDAMFKFGFFVDPILEQKTSDDNKSAPAATNRKLFSADVVPGFPIINISLEPYSGSESTQEEPKKPDKPTPEVNDKLSQLKDQIIQVLTDSGIMLTKKEASNITTVKGLQNLVSRKINNKIVEIFQNSMSVPLNKLIIKMKITEDGVEITYLNQSKELNGETIKQYEYDGDFIKIITNTGRKFILSRNVNNSIKITPVSDTPKIEELTIGGVKQVALTAINTLEGLSSLEKRRLERLLETGFANNNLNGACSQELASTALNPVLEMLNGMYEEVNPNDTNNDSREWNAQIDRIKKELTEIQTKCRND